MKQPLPTYQHHHYFHHHRERTTVGDCCCCLALEPEKRTSFRPGPIGPSRSHPRHFHGNYDKDCQKSRQNMLNKIKHNFMPESNKHINTVVAAQSSSASTSTSSINRDPNEPPTKHPATQPPNHPATHWNHLHTPRTKKWYAHLKHYTKAYKPRIQTNSVRSLSFTSARPVSFAPPIALSFWLSRAVLVCVLKI